MMWKPPRLGESIQEVVVAAHRLDGTEPTAIEIEESTDELLSHLRYVTIDEIVDDTATLVSSPWPSIDDRGRREFKPSRLDDEFAVDVAALDEYLAATRARTTHGDLLPRRPPRLGDAFAVNYAADETLKSGLGDDLAPRPKDLVFDVTRDARLVSAIATVRSQTPAAETTEEQVRPVARDELIPPSPEEQQADRESLRAWLARELSDDQLVGEVAEALPQAVPAARAAEQVQADAPVSEVLSDNELIEDATTAEAIGLGAYLTAGADDPIDTQLNLAAEISQMSSPASVQDVTDQLTAR
jgi:hypothetical protein